MAKITISNTPAIKTDSGGAGSGTDPVAKGASKIKNKTKNFSDSIYFTNIEDTLKDSFLKYAAFVLQRRAIPDVRDGLKYTGRQILHAQWKDKLDAAHPFKKSQKSVAAATSFSYVHGDSACYGQIIKMGRPLVQRYFYEEIEGNGGTPTSVETYAASRYTECRLSTLGMSLFRFLNEDGLTPEELESTYDDEGQFPLVCTNVGFWGGVNGSFGSIGVGLISSIPQFNLKETNAVICQLIKDPNSEIELYPDFASGGILLNPKTTLSSLKLGEGRSAILSGEYELNKAEKYLEITSLPYGLYTDTVCKQLEDELANPNHRLPFSHFKDLSKQTVRIRIYADSTSDLERLPAWLMENTSFKKFFTIKIIMLDGGKLPRLFTLKEALLAHIGHSKKVFRRKFMFNLQKLKDREEILNGLIKAQSCIEEIIAMIKKADGRADVITKLQNEEFKFTERQAEAIADLKLHRLSTLDIRKVTDELLKNLEEQKYINEILTNEELFNNLLIKEYENVAEIYGDERKTKIYSSEEYEEGQKGDSLSGEVYISIDKVSKIEFPESFYISSNEDLVLFTNTLRVFKIDPKTLSLGDIIWGDVVKLKENEKPIAIFKKADCESAEMIKFISEEGVAEVHPSIAAANSSRGRQIERGNFEIQEVHLLDAREGLPHISTLRIR